MSQEIERLLRAERAGRRVRLWWVGVTAGVLGWWGAAWLIRWLTNGGVQRAALAAGRWS